MAKEKTSFEIWIETTLADALKPRANEIFKGLELEPVGEKDPNKQGRGAQWRSIYKAASRGLIVHSGGPKTGIPSNGCFINDFTTPIKYEGKERYGLNLAQYYVYYTRPQIEEGPNKELFIEGVIELCDILGIASPFGNSAIKDFEGIEEEETSLKDWLNDCAKAWELMEEARDKAPETSQAIKYANNRGWTREKLKAARLGVFTPKVWEALPYSIKEVMAEDSTDKDPKKVIWYAESHGIAIPYLIDKVCYGFTFRRTDGKENNTYKNKYGTIKELGHKYMNLARPEYIGGKRKKELQNLGLCGMDTFMKDFIIVEGYLDYYSAKIAGINNLVCAGGKPTNVQIAKAMERRPEKVIILTDRDGSGFLFAQKAGAYAQSLSPQTPVYIAFTPYPYKDLDAYLCGNWENGEQTAPAHTAEDFKNNILPTAVTFSRYLHLLEISLALYGTDSNGRPKNIYDPFNADWNGDADICEKLAKSAIWRKDFIDGNIRRIYEAPREERGLFMEDIKPLEEALNIPAKEIRARVTFLDTQDERAEAEQIYKRLGDLWRSGDFNGFKALLSIEGERIPRDTSHKGLIPYYASGEEVMKERASLKQKELPTGYGFKVKRGKGYVIYPLTLRPEATLICGGTGHGKTTFVNNIGYYVATNNKIRYNKGLDKEPVKVLYLSLELNGYSLQSLLLGLHNGDPEMAKGSKAAQYEDITLEIEQPEKEKEEAIKEEAISYSMLDAIDAYERAEQEAREKYPNDHTKIREETLRLAAPYFNPGEANIKDPDAPQGETHLERYARKREEFCREYLAPGFITIVDKNLTIEKFIPVMRDFVENNSVNLICIDYAQLLETEAKNAQLTERIKIAMEHIRAFADGETTGHKIPILEATQFNRQVVTPAGVDLKNIGEGGDLGRFAGTIIGIEYLANLTPVIGQSATTEIATARLLLREGAGLILPMEKAPMDILEGSNIKIPSLKKVPGILYATILKRRGPARGSIELLTFNDTIGAILPNYTLHSMDLERAQLIGLSLKEDEENTRANAAEQWRRIKSAGADCKPIAIRAEMMDDRAEYLGRLEEIRRREKFAEYAAAAEQKAEEKAFKEEAERKANPTKPKIIGKEEGWPQTESKAEKLREKRKNNLPKALRDQEDKI